MWHITSYAEISAPHFVKDSSVFVQLQLICLSFCSSDVKAKTEIEGPGLTATAMKITETMTEVSPLPTNYPTANFSSDVMAAVIGATLLRKP